MRQGCLVCGQWVSTGLGHSLVMSGVLTEGPSSGRVLVAEDVEGLICSDCRSLDGGIRATRTANELRGQLELVQAELQSCKETVETLEREVAELKATPTRIASNEFPLEIVLG